MNKGEIYYFLGINLLAFLCFGIDKHIAQVNGRGGVQHRRIPEATLLGLAAVGGAMGAWLGMLVFRHKTQHKKFTILVPLILLAQIVLGFFVSYYF